MSAIAQLIVACIVIIAIIAAVATLTWHGSITGEAAVAIFSGVLGGGIVGGAQHVGVSAGAKAAKREGGSY